MIRKSGACGSGGCPGGYGNGNGDPNGCGGNGGCGGGGCMDGRCAASPIPDCYGRQQAVDSQLGGPAGPSAAQVTYPYYTTRGPRDFFAAHPPTIGP